MMLKPCGQAVTMRLTPYFLNCSMFCLRLHLEEVLVARAARHVAAAAFLDAEDREVDAGAVQAGDQGLLHLLVARVEAAGAADEEQVLGRPLLAQLGHRQARRTSPRAPGR